MTRAGNPWATTSNFLPCLSNARNLTASGRGTWPRISGMLNLDTGAARLSVLRAGDSDGTRCDRLFYEYAAARGEGRFLHTYQGDGHPLLPFRGEPARVTVPDSPEAFAEELWDALNRDNRVALCVRYMDIGGGATRLVIKNRHPEGGHHA